MLLPLLAILNVVGAVVNFWLFADDPSGNMVNGLVGVFNACVAVFCYAVYREFG